jgi:hypothetical protein
VVNTAVVGGVKYCLDSNSEPPCGQTVEKAYPPSAPWGTVFDVGVGTKQFIDDTPSGPTTQQQKIISYVAGGLSIPTAVIPLLIFFFAP